MEHAQPHSIRVLEPGEINVLYEFISQLKYAKEIGYFERCFALQVENRRALFGIFVGHELAAYCVYNRAPKYMLFQKLGIPEIQDLNVMTGHRRRGLATALIRYCEALAVKEGFKDMGIGVGLSPSYGAAQRLYAKLGYIPDGNGVTYDRKIMGFGEMRPNDDNMSLMMMKNLG